MIRIKKGDVTIEIDSLPEISRHYKSQEVADMFHTSERTIRSWKLKRGLGQKSQDISGLEIVLFMLKNGSLHL
jgi:hypothetical protein